VLRADGCDSSRITVVNNSIDTTAECAALDEITESQRSALLSALGIPEDAVVGITCTRLYAEKRVDFLIRAADLIRRRLPTFHLIIAGDGEARMVVQQACERQRPHLHYVGEQRGTSKVRLFDLAAFQLMPGPVGLHIVDSLAFLTPLITTDIRTHGPEIAYLRDGHNGLITANTEEAYADAVITLAEDKARLGALVAGCAEARKEYTIERMVERFGRGVLQLLDRPGIGNP
jgi:glycosyltransferase involved in cell wall biosynthesis